MSKKYRKIAGALITLAGEITDNKKLKKSILGTYSDGSTRSVVDAVTGEYLSSSSKEKIKKKKKKNKKHYNKYMKALGYETKYSRGK